MNPASEDMSLLPSATLELTPEDMSILTPVVLERLTGIPSRQFTAWARSRTISERYLKQWAETARTSVGEISQTIELMRSYKRRADQATQKALKIINSRTRQDSQSA
jgi:hypothetical protein